MATYAELLEENSQLRQQVATLMKIVEGQQRRIEELERQIDELRRRGKRQAAPFSKGDPKAKPRRPGRKPGSEYGRQTVRGIPECIDETIEVGCPVYCPHCHGPVSLESTDRQYQVDLPPVRPRTIEFVLHWGHCQRCGRRVQGRHPRQVSDAVRVGQVHFGPGVVGLAAALQKGGGLSYGKISHLLAEWMGLRVARSTLCRALSRDGIFHDLGGRQVSRPSLCLF